jgi:ribosomal-protein-serine acetyltransferase
MTTPNNTEAAHVDTIQVTPDLVLQTIHHRHAAALLTIVNQNREHLREWLPWVDKMQTVEDFHRYIDGSQQMKAGGLDYSFVIIYQEKVVGRIGLHYIQKHNKSAAIGYWLAKEAEGRGLITQSCQALLRYGFTSLDLNRIELKCSTGNWRSAAVAERLRFTKEGVLRQAEWVNTRFLDLYQFSLLREEWSAT